MIKDNIEANSIGWNSTSTFKKKYINNIRYVLESCNKSLLFFLELIINGLCAPLRIWFQNHTIHNITYFYKDKAHKMLALDVVDHKFND